MSRWRDGREFGEFAWQELGGLRQLAHTPPRIVVTDEIVHALPGPPQGAHGGLIPPPPDIRFVRFDRWNLDEPVRFVDDDHRDVLYRIVDHDPALALWLLERPQ